MAVRWRVVEADERTVAELNQSLALPEPLARLLVARGISTSDEAERYFRKSLTDLQNPRELHGVEEASSRVARAVTSQETVFVHGDFDADGITATAVLTVFLRDLGCRVIPFVPNRLVEGHGIAERAIALAAVERASLLITCDCGSSDRVAIGTLHASGIDVVVTDHHHLTGASELGAILVNPKAAGGRGACDDLSGAGVAFMLITAVRTKLRESGFFSGRPEPNLKDYLDIVALGTVADLAPLVGQNRILVAKGLEVLAVSRRPGIVAMRETAGLGNAGSIGAEDVGFRLAPRINAAARLGHAEEALNLLLEGDLLKAERMACDLEAWNLERKTVQAQMLRLATIEAERQAGEEEPALIVGHESFHPGIIGLVAQKLSESYRLPSVVFALEGETVRGSGRSRFGIDLFGALEACADLLVGFGGHREAGGCTLLRQHLPEFTRRFRAAVRQQKNAAPRELSIDASLKFGQINERFLSALDRFRPFGVGNPEPVFTTKARVVGQAKEMGKDHVRVTLVESGGPPVAAVGFGMWRSVGPVLRGDVEVAFTPEENDWNGRREIRIRLQGVRPVQL
ncbi:MAG: single-stranded-DNA-specific exonuclease RecJ [Pseudomonadota bacterium]